MSRLYNDNTYWIIGYDASQYIRIKCHQHASSFTTIVVKKEAKQKLLWHLCYVNQGIILCCIPIGWLVDVVHSSHMVWNGHPKFYPRLTLVASLWQWLSLNLSQCKVGHYFAAMIKDLVFHVFHLAHPKVTQCIPTI